LKVDSQSLERVLIGVITRRLVLDALAETRQPLLWVFKIEEVTKVACHSKMIFRKRVPFLMCDTQL
jgi:hypothetical protein